LISVTNFFRDAPVWEKHKNKYFPDIINKATDGGVLRAWVAGCSSGEEAYSLAITFVEAFEKTRKSKKLTFQIFASDLDFDAIGIARRGVYSNNITADVSPERLNRFFIAEGENFRVVSAIREMVVFANQNVIKDPPFTKLDFLSCRNMLIYMEPELQKKIITLFNYSLNPDGIMVLGTAETVDGGNKRFELIDSKLKIFKHKSAPDSVELADFPSSFSQSKSNVGKKQTTVNAVENIQLLADQYLLQKFTPASAMINDKGDILYITGRTGKYLEPCSGKANLNIYAMARENLRQELPSSIRKAKENYEPVILRNVKIGTNGGTQYVDVTIQRIGGSDSIKDKIMVVFTDVPTPIELDKATGKRRSTGNCKQLELELQRSYEIIQSTREEMMTSQEELKSTNEELQSTNEEMQSTNEELLTSKEEMQSLNEELQTLNVELQSKLNDFVRANDDMVNLLNSTEIATLFLDKDLNIRKYTDKVTSIIKLRHSDIGRPFTDLVTDLRYPEIGIHAKQVLATLMYIEKAISTNDERWFNVRIMPYRTTDDYIDGLVMTFTDITMFKNIESNLTVSELRYRRLFESSNDGILVLDAETGKIIDVNPFLINMLGYPIEQLIKKTIWDIGLLKDIVANKEHFLELQQKEYIRYENFPHETADGRKINVEFISNVYSVGYQKIIQCNIRKNFVQKEL